MSDIKFFNRWSAEGVHVADPGLTDYISVKPAIMPRSGARYAQQRFHKSRASIIERLMNKLMVPGHKSKKHKRTSYPLSGKAFRAYDIVCETLAVLEKRTRENPVKVLAKAVEHAAPREEIISIEYGGARYPKAVDCAPQRRIDIALRYMAQGAFEKSFNTKKSAVAALADEILAAYERNSASNAIAKKLEIERQADSSR